MYSKQEAGLIRKNFWTSFGQYMKPLPGAEGETVNWLNYKTGIKNIFFRMDADNKHAQIAIELAHPDPLQREHYYQQFEQLKSMLKEITGEEWYWEKDKADEQGKSYSSIGIQLKDVNIFDTNDWPAIISFLKPRIIALDKFWSLVKDGFN